MASQSVPELPDPIDIGNGRWKYRDEWFKKIWWDADLDEMLDSDGATVAFSMHFGFYGTAAHKQIKSLNVFLGRVKKTSFGTATEEYVSQLLHDLDGICQTLNGGFRQERLIELMHDELEAVNYVNAPNTLREQAEEVFELVKSGIEHFEKIKAHLRGVQQSRFDEKDVQLDLVECESELPSRRMLRLKQQQEALYGVSKWEAVEVKHASVREGFIYVLSNRLMPGIFKIGFTARNPDERAKELSAKVGLPYAFIVEKYWRTYDPYIVEQRIFQRLESNRVHDKEEYFEGEFSFFSDVIETLLVRNPT